MNTVGSRVGTAAVCTAAVLLLSVQTGYGVIVRTKADMRLWETVHDRSDLLAWPWEEAADSATLVFSNRLTCAVETLDVSRVSGETRGFCAQPSQDRETIVDVSLVQKADGAEVSRETATLAYVDGAGGGPITVRARAYGEWRRVRSPRVFAFDPEWSGGTGESGYDIAPPYDPAISIRIR